MSKIEKWDRASGASILVAAGVFTIMLVLNIFTPFICDDFSYWHNFKTGLPLRSILEIPESMYAHSFSMNGRLISHGLTQVTMLMPAIVFDIVNAAVFTLTLYAAAGLCARRHSAVLYGMVFCLMWLFTPSFGQVVLWQVGSVNYFWSLTFCILFFAPELLRFRDGRILLRKSWHWAAFCVYSFFFGWYNEIASFVGICMVLCLIVLDVWMNRAKLRLYRFLPVVFAAAGYLVMLSMPAQSANKQATGLTLAVLVKNVLVCTFKLLQYAAPLLALFAVLFVLALRCRVGIKTLVLSGLFALAGVCANYMPIVATYYPERCMCTTILMLVMASAFLAAELIRKNGIRELCIGCVLLLALTFSSGLGASQDIVNCYRQYAQREAIIEEAVASGEQSVVVHVVVPKTAYSAFYDLRDLCTGDPEDWPNPAMANYYGIGQIIAEFPDT